jgi:hypothetical protein
LRTDCHWGQSIYRKYGERIWFLLSFGIRNKKNELKMQMILTDPYVSQCAINHVTHGAGG